MCHTVQYIAVNTLHWYTHTLYLGEYTLTHTAAAATVSLHTLQCDYDSLRGEDEDEVGDVRTEGTVCTTCYDPNSMLAVSTVSMDCKYLYCTVEQHVI